VKERYDPELAGQTYHLEKNMDNDGKITPDFFGAMVEGQAVF
jgi:hypothetical protein